jgi:hypothetical protein
MGWSERRIRTSPTNSSALSYPSAERFAKAMQQVGILAIEGPQGRVGILRQPGVP